MDIWVEGQKYELKLEPRVVKSLSKGKVTLDGIIHVLTKNGAFLAPIDDDTFLIEAKKAVVAGFKYGNRIELEFADSQESITKIGIGDKGVRDKGIRD